MKSLTKRQEEVLQFLKEYKNNNGYIPSIREVADFFAMSPKGAYDHIRALEKKYMLKRAHGKSRAVEITGEDEAVAEKPALYESNVNTVSSNEFAPIPILGNIAAGAPLLAEQNFDGYVQVHKSFLKKRGDYFALRVKGDSMKDAGILDGDVAFFIQQVTAENGAIVAAFLSEESVTLKRFYKENNRVKLKAENPVYPPIYTQNVRILGRLIGVLRNYE